VDSSARPVAQTAPRDRGLAVLATIIVWLLIVLMIVPEGFDYGLLTQGTVPISADFITRLLWLGLLVGGAAIVLWRSGASLQMLCQSNPYLLAFFALAVLSIVWSLEPRLTLRRDVRFLTFLLAAVAFAVTAWHPRHWQRAMRPVLTVMLLGSIVFGLLEPKLGIHQETTHELTGAWRGLANHKNSLGAIASVAVLLWLHAWGTHEVRWWRALGAAAIAMTCLVLSRSTTSMIATVGSCAVLGMLLKWPQVSRFLLQYAVALVPIAIVCYLLVLLRVLPGLHFVLSPGAALTGGDMTLTGRSEIWFIITDHIRAHPFVGSGYAAYWVGPDPQSPSYEFITRMNGFYPGSSHNGYLEIANDLGWAGIILLAGYLAKFLQQATVAFDIDRPQGALYIALLAQQSVLNLSESHWFSPLSVQFLMMTIATMSLGRLMLEYQLRLRMGMRLHTRAPVVRPGWRIQRPSA
jgi:exopolysaccharide production protein ExoQ